MNDALLTIFFSHFARNRDIFNRNGSVDLSHHCCHVMLVSLETSIQSAHPSISVSKTGDSAQWRYWSSSIDPYISVIHSRSTNHMICQNSPRTSRVLWYHLEGIWQLSFAPGGMVKLKSQIYGSMNLSMLLLSAPYALALSSVSARWLEAIRETWYSTTLFFFFSFLRGVPWLVVLFSDVPGHSCQALSVDW